MKYLSLLIVLFSSTVFAHSSSYKYKYHCYPPTVIQNDRCSYKRVGDDLVGTCTNWEETKVWKTVEIDYYQPKVKQRPPTIQEISTFDIGKIK